MSAVYLYGVTDRGTAVPDGARALAVDGIAAVYRPAGDEPPRPTEDALWAHEAVVEKLLEAGPVLPARFGTVVASCERLRVELENRRDEFRRALDFVRGRIEIGVRAAWPEQTFEDTRGDSGRAYLARKRKEHEATAAATGAVHEPLEKIAVASTVDVRREPCLTLAASYLVERGDVERFREQAEVLANDVDGVVLACTGPWPPYSFATPPERA
jgi:hypothetical protein